ncbi:TerD family protein [Zooshikella harenae]|uniref:Tellurium resistance TerZ family protein n=1 Tax=Zooshikella harenae TaxID=2827238 RepID=A0ABS5ZEU3_9GAMM|nr:TerD family protein [Zooshikella harenae]MBU2712495.1 tellurium resistance TerZ family protein [Zooshikella harenae]
MAISLTKGQRISLEKEAGKSLQQICVGVNWGAIEKKGFFGTKKVPVDLDASVGLYNDKKEPVDVVYFGQLRSKCGSIHHSGDDLTGDMDGDDGLDNEVVTISLQQVPHEVSAVAVVLNSFRKQDFAAIPFASIRLYEGTPSRVNNILATYDIANDPSFSGSVTMVLGILYKKDGDWKFKAVGEPTKDQGLEQTIITVARSYI